MSVETPSNSIAVDNLEEKVGVAQIATQSPNQPFHPNLHNDEDYPNLEHKKATGNIGLVECGRRERKV